MKSDSQFFSNILGHKIGICRNDLVCPGWMTHTWNIFFDDRIPVENKIMYKGEQFHPYCRPCAPMNMFWISMSPDLHRGVVICLPDPVAQLSMLWHAQLSTVIYFLLFAFVALLFIRRYISKGIADIFLAPIEEATAVITRGRGRPKKPKDE